MMKDLKHKGKTALESKLAYYAAEKQRNVNDLVRLFMADTTVSGTYDSIETALAHVSTPGSYYLQAFARYNKGDSLGVINKLSDVTSDFDLSSYENTVHSAYNDYFNILLTLKSENKPVTAVDSAQKATLHNIVQNAGGLVQALARNILIKTGDIVYNEPYILIDTTTNKTARAYKPLYGTNNETESYIKLYPNPANQYITIEYNIQLNTGDAVLEIVTLKGLHKEAIRLTTGWGEKIIDLRNYTSGTYIVRLYINGKYVESKKFVKL